MHLARTGACFRTPRFANKIPPGQALTAHDCTTGPGKWGQVEMWLNLSWNLNKRNLSAAEENYNLFICKCVLLASPGSDTPHTYIDHVYALMQWSEERSEVYF